MPIPTRSCFQRFQVLRNVSKFVLSLSHISSAVRSSVSIINSRANYEWLYVKVCIKMMNPTKLSMFFVLIFLISSPRQTRPRKALPAPEQLALPTPAKDKFEAYLEQVEAFRMRTQQERERLFHTALDLVDVYKTGGALSRALFSVISDWLDKTALSPTSIFDSCLTPYAPILIVRELERKLPNIQDFLPGKKR